MKFRARRVEEPEVNLISFIDVVLMIVIFFMLSSTFSQEGRLKIRLPEAGIAAVPRTATPPIILAVSADGVYQINGTLVDGTDSGTLRAALVAVASGFLSPSNNSNGPAFGIWVALPSGGDLIPLPIATEPSARVQVIHNSADAGRSIGLDSSEGLEGQGDG
jgi:biopolymer transport protein ExbD